VALLRCVVVANVIDKLDHRTNHEDEACAPRYHLACRPTVSTSSTDD